MSAGSAPRRAIAFFDGQNLFAAARDAFGFTTASYGVPRLAHAIALQRAGRNQEALELLGRAAAIDSKYRFEYRALEQALGKH